MARQERSYHGRSVGADNLLLVVIDSGQILQNTPEILFYMTSLTFTI